jgi:exoenzyme U
VTLQAPDKNAPLTKAAQQPKIWTQTVGAALQASPGQQPAPIASAVPTGKTTSIATKSGKKLAVVTGADGRIALTAEPPPIQEVTFSGGGGKGAALPGAAKALQESGVLKEVKVFHGASVGSMTAAILAAGITAEGITEIANDTKMAPLVKGGSILPIQVSGDKLEDWVRGELGKSVRGRIAEYAKAHGEDGDPATLKALQAIDKKLAGGGGVTFGDLRTLSKSIPEIKELVVSGTMMGDDSGPSGKMEKGKPQLAIFSADTEPDLDVARAVHASAALPPVFKPVDIKLSSGMTARFEDGGVMNNAPTSDLIGAERQLDPVPDKGNLTFVFESEESDEVTAGVATPSRSRINDLVARAPNSAAEFALHRGLADKPEDVVVVPLKFKGPWYKRTDFSGFIGGTINFDIAKDSRLKLQSMTEDATLAHVKNRRMPETREYASPQEMLNKVGRSDLEAMAESDYPGAKEELKFRDDVAGGIKALEGMASGVKAAALKQGPVQKALQQLNDLAKGDRDRLAFIGRELNRSGKLDPMLDVAKSSGAEGLPALDAGVAVADALKAKSHAATVLRDVIYPKMVAQGAKGSGAAVLRQVDNMLRAATSPEDVNDALTIAIKHFETKRDVLNRHKHHAFAAELKTYLMRVG